LGHEHPLCADDGPGLRGLGEDGPPDHRDDPQIDSGLCLPRVAGTPPKPVSHLLDGQGGVSALPGFGACAWLGQVLCELVSGFDSEFAECFA
jgi:hypothetical protein